MISSLLRLLSLVGLFVVPAIFLDSLVKSTLLLMLGLLLCVVMRRWSAAAKHHLLGLTMAGLCLIPVLSVFGPQLRVLPASFTLALQQPAPPPAQPFQNQKEFSSQSATWSLVDQANEPVALPSKNLVAASNVPSALESPIVHPTGSIESDSQTEASAMGWLPMVWQAVVALWLAGCLVVLSRLGLALLRLRRMTGRTLSLIHI